MNIIQFLNENVSVEFRGIFAIIHMTVLVSAYIVCFYMLVSSNMFQNLITRFQRTPISKFIFYYKSKWKYRKESKDEYIEHMSYMWKGGFVLDYHMKKLVGKTKLNEMKSKRLSKETIKRLRKEMGIK